jgi:pimeloyl-ACP methyl ester carboxylesterase
MQLLPLSMPTVIVHGDDDMTIPVARSREYLEAARAAGADVELVEPRPGGHRSHIDPRSNAWRAAVEWLSAQRQTSPQAAR